ncbi:NADH-quinone oxidoreductase subunit NuoF [Microaceticoccus formicicus]|uniref:NADH-quinone oxidoreductase subunit NuoF n=1 Tax=Microaceticoccus formicicus TaxID=3118105 RepID=UPI003CD04042|nr:NADH-quinone oxidoreductase subunit NuoF [Peptoniphilaceae bacterium AMB_02]
MNLEQLREIKERVLPTMSLRKDIWSDIPSVYNKQVLICMDTGCKSSRADVLEQEFRKEVEAKGLTDEIDIRRVGCFGLCEAGPIAIVYPGEKFYAYLKPEDAKTIVEEDLIGGNTVEKLIFKEALTDGAMQGLYDVAFYRKQKKLATGNCGVIDPDSIEEYIAVDGYLALYKVLNEMTPEDVINELKESGLRGRGGGGFPTGLKWEFTKNAKGDIKYVVVNADEGDPGAFMDRSILEGDPFTIIEAMTIAGYAINAHQGFIYIRAEYPSAVKKLENCIQIATSMGLLGKNIMGSGFDFELEIRLGAGAFVCGEEMALIESIEGKRGIPRNKPPFPANEGLFGKPTLINNVETLANIPRIINHGHEWFRSFGTEKSPGTKVFTLGGDINRTGIIEVPMGLTLREIIFEVGGGIIGGKEFKAVQTGGPSGGCITAEHLDTPIDYDNLSALGSMMGSGGMIVMDEDTCMVDIARFFLEFTVDESCGKCTPCREGTKRMLEMLETITHGNGTPEMVEKLASLGETIKATSLCGLGQTAPNPVLSTMRYFKQEYDDHVSNDTCIAGICRDLVSYTINDNCTGCTLCARKCPVECITGERREMHYIDQEACIQCGDCYAACNFNAIDRGGRL